MKNWACAKKCGQAKKEYRHALNHMTPPFTVLHVGTLQDFMVKNFWPRPQPCYFIFYQLKLTLYTVK